MSNKNLNILYLSGIFIILILPILSIPPFFHPPAWAKEIIFRSIFSILLFAFIYQIIFKSSDKLSVVRKILTDRKNNLFVLSWLLLAMILLFIISNIFSADPFFSFWSSPTRGGGTLSFIFVSLFCLFTYLIINAKNWKRVWDISIVIGFLTCLVAIFQKFNLFSNFFLQYSDRPVSTFGGSIFFGLYLILTLFLAISFGLLTKGPKRYWYFIYAATNLFCIFLSGTRAVLLGFTVGVSFFILFFPNKNKLTKLVKIGFVSLIILSIIFVFFLKSQPQLVNNISSNKYFGSNFSRLWNVVGNFSVKEIYTARASGWTVAVKGILERPLFGWGPANFSIPFDKHYDSKMPGLMADQNYSDGFAGNMTWWDKGHSFVIDYAATVGIPFVIIYILFNGLIIWQLNKISKAQTQETRIIIRGIQATIIGYLISNLFSFDVFETYLIYFLLIGYSFFLLSPIKEEQHNFSERKNIIGTGKKVIITVFAVILIWFLWSYNIKPMQINAQINTINFLALKNDECISSMQLADSLLTQHSILDNYLRLSYIDDIAICAEKHPEKNVEYSYKVLSLLDDCIKERPTFTRNWIFQGVHAYNILIDDKNLDQKEKDKLANIAYSSFPRAIELSPGRQTAYIGWVKTDLYFKKYDDAQKKADQCINLNPEFADCWWVKSLAYVKNGNLEEGAKTIEQSIEKGYFHNQYSENTLGQLANIYSEAIKSGSTQYYDVLSKIFLELIKVNPNGFQYHASLAFTYKLMGQYDNARKEALKVIELSPQSKPNVEAFINSLPK